MAQAAVVNVLPQAVAKDFANYLELYYKYQADYQIDAIMEGKIDEMLVRKTKYASFDEKLSVVSLILAKVTEAFRGAYKKEACVTLLFEKLKTYKAALDTAEHPVSCLEAILGETISLLEYKKKAKIHK